VPVVSQPVSPRMISSGRSAVAGPPAVRCRTSYPIIDPLNEKQGKDLRAVRQWLLQEFTIYDLIADMPWPAHTPASTVMPVLLRGREELQAVVRNFSEMHVVSPPRRLGPRIPNRLPLPIDGKCDPTTGA
jgi:hypothetical protein